MVGGRGRRWSWPSVFMAVGDRGRRSLSSVIGLQLSSLSVMIMTAIIVLPVMSTAPSMAEDHTSVEPAGGAEKAPHCRTRGIGAQGIRWAREPGRLEGPRRWETRRGWGAC